MTQVRAKELGGPNFPAADRDARAEIGVIRVENVFPVAGAGHPGLHDEPGQVLRIRRGDIGTFPDVFSPDVDGVGVIRFETIAGSQAFRIGMAEKVPDQHIDRIGFGNFAERVLPVYGRQVMLPANFIG